MNLNIFKYYPPKFEDEWNLAFYEKDQIYFQIPAKFNDPWDCKGPSLTILSRKKEYLKSLVFEATKRRGRDFSEESWNRIKELPRSEIIKVVKNNLYDAIDRVRNHVGVFSASCIPDSELLWSHYGESHKGYMLHLEINLDKYVQRKVLNDDLVPIPVIYANDRQIWDVSEYHSNEMQHVYDLIRYKSKAWEYEYEIRLLSAKKYGFIDTPGSWLKSIVIGLNADPKLRNILVAAGKDLGIPVYHAEMNSSEFNVDIPEFKIDSLQGKENYNKIIASQILDIPANE